MMDRKIFFAHVRLSLFGGTLLPGQVGGTSAILDEWDKRKLTVTEHLAYMLATVFHECARTMQPIAEYGGAHARYAPFYGRGFVQLTWKANYEKASNAVGVDLVLRPDRALELPIATQILFDGMAEGWFTGKKLADYITDAGHCYYVNARRIINGTDRASQIATYAVAFEAAIEAAEQGQPPQPDMPVIGRGPVEVPAPKPKPSATTPGQKAAGAAGAVIVAGSAAAASSAHPWLWVAAIAAIVIVGVAGFLIVKSKVKK
jgi:putative chitinase